MEIAYTLQRDTQSPSTLPPQDYPIMLPRGFTVVPTYQVISCLSLDAANCVVPASVMTISSSDGAVWNTLALTDIFRGRVDQTPFVVHECNDPGRRH